MANLLRRAGAQIWALLSNAAAPGTDATSVQWFAQTVAGVIQMFMEDGDGLIYQVTPSISVARAMMYYSEDFASSSAVQTTSSGGSVAFTTAVQGHPGILRQSFNAVADTTCSQPTTSVFNILLGSGEVVCECDRRTPVVQNGTNQWTDRFGLGDTVSGDQANGVYFESDRAVNGDNNYRICAASGGTRTKTTTGLSPTVGAFERWRFVVNAGATSIQAYMNDTAAGSAVTTNIPTANGLAAWLIQSTKTLGASAIVLDADYIETYQVVSR